MPSGTGTQGDATPRPVTDCCAASVHAGAPSAPPRAAGCRGRPCVRQHRAARLLGGCPGCWLGLEVKWCMLAGVRIARLPLAGNEDSVNRECASARAHARRWAAPPPIHPPQRRRRLRRGRAGRAWSPAWTARRGAGVHSIRAAAAPTTRCAAPWRIQRGVRYRAAGFITSQRRAGPGAIAGNRRSFLSPQPRRADEAAGTRQATQSTSERPGQLLRGVSRG